MLKTKCIRAGLTLLLVTIMGTWGARNAQARTLEESLAAAIRLRNPSHVQMILVNHSPHLLQRVGNDSLLAIALFPVGGDASGSDLDFTDAQKQILDLLLEAEPKLLDVLTGSRFASIFFHILERYGWTLQHYGSKEAEKVEQRYAYLVEKYSRLTDPMDSYVSYNGKARPLAMVLLEMGFGSTLEMAARHGFDFERSYEVDGEKMNSLSFAAHRALFADGKESVAFWLRSLREILTAGADPGAVQDHPTAPRELYPSLYEMVIGYWISYLISGNEKFGRDVPYLTFAAPQILRLFFEYEPELMKKFFRRPGGHLETAFERAISMKAGPVVRFLLEVDPTLVHEGRGEPYVITPIVRATLMGSPEIVELLVDFGAEMEGVKVLLIESILQLAFDRNEMERALENLRVLLRNGLQIARDEFLYGVASYETRKIENASVGARFRGFVDSEEFRHPEKREKRQSRGFLQLVDGCGSRLRGLK